MTPTERALTVLRADPNTPPETEPALLQRRGNDIAVVLDDGGEITFDSLELRVAVNDLAAPRDVADAA